MAKQEIGIAGFTGMNRSLPPHQLNPTADGDVRLHETVGLDPSARREIVPRMAWKLLDDPVGASKIWPRRIDNATQDYDTS